MKALVTGGNGFVGQSVVWELAKRDDIDEVISIGNSDKDYYEIEQIFQNGQMHIFKIMNYKCDITKPAIQSLIIDTKPDIIFHLAANPNTKEDKENPTKITETNVVGTHRILSACKPGTRFVFASSVVVYGNQGKYGVTEQRILTPNSAYGASKVAGEALVNAYNEQGKISGLNLRLVGQVGVYSTHGVVKDIVAKLRSNSEFLELLGDKPGSTKHFMLVQDTAKTMIEFGLNFNICGNVNISTDDVLSTEQLANIIMDELGIKKEIKWLGEQANWCGDNKIVNVSNNTAKALGMNLRFWRSEDAVRHVIREMRR